MPVRYTAIIAGLVSLLLGAALLSLPAGAAGQDERLNGLADDCTKAHGYDPRSPGPVGESALAENERAWRDCMRAGIRDTLMRKSPVPAEWQALIDADIRMTDAIEAGTLTRSQRAASLQLHIVNIRIAEAVARDRIVDATRQQLEIYDEIEQIRRNIPRYF